MTVAELLGRISSAELAEWMAYEGLEPFGPPAEAFAAGVVASTIYNMGRRRGAKALSAGDFMPQIHRPDEPPAVRKRRADRALSAKIKAALGPRPKG